MHNQKDIILDELKIKVIKQSEEIERLSLTSKMQVGLPNLNINNNDNND